MPFHEFCSRRKFANNRNNWRLCQTILCQWVRLARVGARSAGDAGGREGEIGGIIENCCFKSFPEFSVSGLAHRSAGGGGSECA